LTITAQDRHKVQIFSAPLYFEGHTALTIRLMDEYAIAEHAVDEIGWRVVEHDNLYRAVQELLQLGLGFQR
jgi:hypothetical protein